MNFSKTVPLLLSLCYVSAFNNGSATILNVATLGTLDGLIGETYFSQRQIIKFYGINYAKPPSGQRRFKPPEEFPGWTGVYDATKMRQQCPQIPMDYYPSPDPSRLDVKEDIEDCLVVNVFTPMRAENRQFPVMFYIHGGSFYLGSAYEFQPEFLLEKDIVLVVPQYRLGAFGFLSMDNEDIPGNVGMLDILMALRWVKKHIAHFGGDPMQITVVGHSAGAAAASSLLISPLVQPGLIQKMIIQSGSILAPWTVDDNPMDTVKKIGELAGCRTNNLGELAACLREVPPMSLASVHAKYMEVDMSRGGTGNGGRSLVVQSQGVHKYLTMRPEIAFINNMKLTIPVMGGVVRDEGSIFLADKYKEIKLFHARNISRREITGIIIRSFGISDTYGYITDSYQNTFFKPEEQFLEMMPGYMNLLGVLIIKQSVLRVFQEMSTKYLYTFDFSGGISKVKDSRPNWDQEFPFPSGVAHADELGYLFPSANSNYADQELEMVKKMTKLWADFITGRHMEDWPRMVSEYGPYLRISDDLEVKQNFYDEFTPVSGGFSLNTFALAPVIVLIFIVLNRSRCLLTALLI